MSTFRPYTVQCVCQHAFRVQLAVAVNPVRMPHLRDAILDGSLHRVTCPACGRRFTAQKAFVYADLRTGLIVQVHPPGHAPRWREASRALNGDLDAIDEHGVVKKGVTRRVAFGIGELREKLVAQDAGLDDRHVELAKVLAIHEHPVLLRKPRLRLFLGQAHEDRLRFFAGYDHADQAFQVDVPHFAFDRLSRGVAERWVDSAHRTNMFTAPDDLWVSVRRWAPGNTALSTLHASADAVRAGSPLDLDSDAFRLMVKNLPHGSQLPSSAKIDLRDIEKYARSKKRGDIQDALFEVRFGILLDDEWGKDRETGDIDTLWDLLKDLPDTNVEGNAELHEVFLKPGEGGGLYNPSSNDVEVTSDPSGDSFPNVIRHEIGHAVQDKLDKEQKKLVIAFLTQRYGWVSYPGNSSGAQDWAKTMKGWDRLGDKDRRRIADTLVKSLGRGSSWNPPAPVTPPGPAWSAADFGPRLAVEGSLEKWYSSNSKWYRTGGKAYFLNYWYRLFMAVDETALAFINTQMPWDYAAMSPAEFFAELYALYYDLDNPHRSAISAEIAAWFDANVGVPRAGAPLPPPP